MKSTICTAALFAALACPATAEVLFKLNFDEAASGKFTSGTLYTHGSTETVNPAAGGLGSAVLRFAGGGATDGAEIGDPPTTVTGTSQGGKALLVDSGSGQDEGLRIFVDNGLTSESFTMETIWYTNDVSGGTNKGAGTQNVIGDNWPDLLVESIGPQPQEADFVIRIQGPNTLTYFGDRGGHVNAAQAGVNQSGRWYHDALVYTYNADDPANSQVQGFRNGVLRGTARYDATQGHIVELFGPTSLTENRRFLTIGFNNSYEFRAADEQRGLNGGVDAIAISKGALAPADFELPFTPDAVHPDDAGIYSAQVTNTTPAFTGTQDVGFDRDAARLQVTAGDVLRLTFWMKNGRADLSTTSSMRRVTFAAFADTTFISDTNFLANALIPDVWTYYTLTYTVPATVTNVNLSFRPDFGGDSVILDNVSVVNLSNGNQELLTNGDFEDWPGSDSSEPTGWRFFAANGTGEIHRIAPPVTSARDWMLFE